MGRYRVTSEVLPQGYSLEELTVLQVFHPFTCAKTLDALRGGIRFVHYTSADAAAAMIKTREVWMRKSSCMNDYMEIEYGFECLNEAYKSRRNDLAKLLDSIFPGFCAKLEERFNEWLPHFRRDCYITCLSEHDADEDKIGRLSMWRGYGSTSRVGIVVKSMPFLTPTDALKAYTSPVAYLSKVSFDETFSKFVEGLGANAGLIQSLGEEVVFAHIFAEFRSRILCTKHPGFKEEREWRIIYSPTFEKSERLIADVQSISGVPQPIYKIPLRDVPDEGLVGVEIPELVERIIIGPTQFPGAMYEAFVTLLAQAGMQDASKRVCVSDIPLR